MNHLEGRLQSVAERLRPHHQAIIDDWTRSLAPSGSPREGEVRESCARSLDALFVRLSAGDVDGLLTEDARQAALDARRGASSLGQARAIRALGRCLGAYLRRGEGPTEEGLETLLAVEELGMLRVEALLTALEDESARRLVEAQEQGARATERARESRRRNQALRRTEAESRHRAEQLALLAAVAHRIAPIREPGDVMQQAVDTIRTRMNHTYVALVVLDDGGGLVGRWSGRPGVGRESKGRAEGPPGGVIGRALRLGAPQVVGDVSVDADYHPDVPGTRSEMVIPLLEGAEAIGALDFQSERSYAFGLDDVAAGETLAEFLVIAIENARLHQLCRGGDGQV
jgi:putative methionine-R-sulfoxide reductase with GAF domain